MADRKTLLYANGDSGMPGYAPQLLKEQSDGTYAPQVAVTNQPTSLSVVQPSSATVTTIATTTTSTTLAAANPNRKGLIITSVSGTILIKEGSGATSTSYTYRIVTNGAVEFQKPVYTGIVTGVGAGQVTVTEET